LGMAEWRKVRKLPRNASVTRQQVRAAILKVAHRQAEAAAAAATPKRISAKTVGTRK